MMKSYFNLIAGSHGVYDGLYWQEMYTNTDWANSPNTGPAKIPELRLRWFIEGYLTCHAHLNRNKGGAFSRSAAEYVRLISGWYRLDPKTANIDPERGMTAIADVLFRFRD